VSAQDVAQWMANDRTCDHCKAYFARFSCGKGRAPFECDCPKCQGYCECRLIRMVTEVKKESARLADRRSR